MKNYLLNIIICFFLTLTVHAQTTILPVKSYGVWDRSNAYDISVNTDYNYLKGKSADVNWKDVQAINSSQYDWSEIRSILQTAYNNNQMVNISVGVGPDAPVWIYTNGVPSVTTNDTQHPNWTQYPYYLDADYKTYYYNMIENFGSFLRTLPSNLFNQIAYIQVKTGCTGDEVAYKGTPTNSSYTISDNQWRTFRLEVFEKFRLTFNTGTTSTQIGLLFNNIDPVDQTTEWQWVLNNVTYGFGTKGGAYARGHHLSDELDFKTTWNPYLVNPQGLHLFSAAEMDQTWTKPLYQINVPLGFYWGALSGLNTGLSVWLVTQSALQEAQTRPELHNVFKFFNKYSKQIYPSTADAAYSIFHEGLNAQNTTKFPENIYGQANKSNQSRYIAICSAYASRGAQMNDVSSATQGQVYQRDSQTGYNDAGWKIEEGNYERWINQINPDATSIGLFRVRGVINSSSSIYDRFARSFENSSGKNTMYFKFHSDVFSLSNPDSLTFTITWLDKNLNSTWALKYYNSSGLQTALNITGIGDNQWKTTSVVVRNPIINQNGTLGSNFMLVNTDNIDDIFHGVQVDITRIVATLPIELLSFNGEHSNKGNLLKWSTATEKNNNYFCIESSQNGVEFQKIGQVTGMGNSQTKNYYQFTDANPPKSIRYYRLKQYDTNNNYTYSKVISIHHETAASNISIYPNPVKDVLFIKDISKSFDYKIINMSGIVIQSGSATTKSLSVSALAAGIYYLQINQQQTLRFTKN